MTSVTVIAYIDIVPPPDVIKQVGEYVLDGWITSISWSPDSALVAVSSSTGKIWVLETFPAASIIWSFSSTAAFWEISWSPDGRYIAAVGNEGVIYVFDATYGSIVWISDYIASLYCVAWSPDGSKIAVSGSSGKVYVFDFNGRKLLWESQTLGAWTGSVAWSPDGKKLAIGTGEFTDPRTGKIYLLDASNGSVIWSTPYVLGSVAGLDWSKYGNLLVAGTGYSDGGNVLLINSSNGYVLWNTTLDGYVSMVSFNSDGSKILADGGNHAWILDSTTGSVLWRTPYSQSGYLSASWSSDERQIAVGTYNATLEIYHDTAVSVYPYATWFYTQYGVIKLKGIPYSDVVIKGNGETRTFTISPSGFLNVYVNPGTYNIYVNINPDIGTGGEILVASVNMSYITEGLGVIDTVTINTNIKTLVRIYNPWTRDVNIFIKWQDGAKSFVVKPLSYLELTAIPGTYNLIADYTKIINVNKILGNLSYLIFEKIFYINFNPYYPYPYNSINITLLNPDDLLGNIRLIAHSNALLSIDWNIGSRNIEISSGDILLFDAVPGVYKVTYNIEPPSSSDIILGDSRAYLYGILYTRVDARSTSEIIIPAIDEVLGRIRIDNNHYDPVNVTVIWPGNSYVFTLEPFESALFYAAPHDYTVKLEYTVRVTGDIGLLTKVIKESHAITVRPGKVENVTIQPVSIQTGVIRLVNPGTTFATVQIYWQDKKDEYKLAPGDTISLSAAPGTYYVYYSLEPPEGTIGPRKALDNVLSGQFAINLREKDITDVTIPSSAELTPRLLLYNNAEIGVLLIIKWENGKHTLTLDPGQSTALFAAPTLYEIEVHVDSREFIGKVSNPVTRLNINVNPMKTDNVLSITNNMVPLPGSIEISNPNRYPSWVVIDWGEDRINRTLGEGISMKLSAWPGEYIIEYMIEANDVIGYREGYLHNTKTIVVEPDKDTRFSLTRLDDIVSTLVITKTFEEKVNITLRWNGQEYKLTTLDGEDLYYTIKLTPGEYQLHVDFFFRPEVGLSYSDSYVKTLLVEPNRLYQLTLDTNMINVPGKLEIVNPTNNKYDVTNLSILWENGKYNHEQPIRPGASIYLSAAPQKYEVVYEVPMFLDGEIVGREDPVTVRETVKVEPGQVARVVVKTLDEVYSRLSILNPNDYDINIDILWQGGKRHFTLKEGEVLKVYTYPDIYTVTFSLADSPEILGAPTKLVVKQTFDIKSGESKQIQVPDLLDSVSTLSLEAPPNTLLLIEWDKGEKTIKVPSNGTILLNLMKGLEYRVYLLDESGQPSLVTVFVAESDIIETTVTTPLHTITNIQDHKTIETMITETTTTHSETPTIVTNIITSTLTMTTPLNNTPNTSNMQPLSNTQSTTQIQKVLQTDTTTEQKPEQTMQTPSPVVATTSTSINQDKFNVNDQVQINQPYLYVALGLLAVGGMVSLIKRAQMRKSVEKQPQITGIISRDNVENLLGKTIIGVKAGPNCMSNVFTFFVSKGLIQEEYEGEWRCCRLGCGGWGCAYRCERSNDGVNNGDGKGGVVVFKVPRGLEVLVEGSRGSMPTVSQRMVERVRRESEVLRGLSHPHLLRLLGASRSVPLLVYEYADGGSLEYQLGSGWSPGLGDVLLIGVQLGDALRYIHSRGLVHGDVKPENVFFAGGVVKLGDFSSITRLLASTTQSTVFATPGWSAPEQVFSDLRLRAKERGLENRVDVYQLGNLILYMMSGEAIDGEEALDEKRRNEVLSRVEDGALRDLLGEMLSPQPWDRPSMDEVVRRLAELYWDRREK